jgi:hypothetical protein
MAEFLQKDLQKAYDDGGRWEVMTTAINQVHVLPIRDLKPHTEALFCRCQPRVEQQSAGDLPMIVHNAYDGREFYE